MECTLLYLTNNSFPLSASCLPLLAAFGRLHPTARPSHQHRTASSAEKLALVFVVGACVLLPIYLLSSTCLFDYLLYKYRKTA